MPHADLDAVRLHYELGGRSGAPVLLFSNSLGTDLHMWDTVVPRFTDDFQVLRYDTRGHGKSSAPPDDYSFSMLGGDVLGLLEFLAIDRVIFCGISLGGMTGQWLASRPDSRIDKLVLSNTAARIGTRQAWNERIDAVSAEGVASMTRGLFDRWFSPEFQTREPETVSTLRAALNETSLHGYCGCCAAIRDSDFYSALGLIRCPTLVTFGNADPVTPPADSMQLIRGIEGAEYLELSGRHLAPLEDVATFSRVCLKFFQGSGAGSREGSREDSGAVDG